MIAPTSAAAGACSNSGCMRAIRYTPAVTIVAAWIRAETGVGPSMASGSQVWSGTWADLANAPTSSRHAAGHEVGVVAREVLRRRCRTSCRKSSVPELLKMKYVPSTRPTSPTTLITNALMPAAVAVVAPVPERDQEVRGGADERPADDQHHEVRRHDQQQHAEHEEVQVGEEARVAAVAAHVGDRVEVDQHRDAGDDQHHQHAERVDQDRDLRVDAARHRVVPADRDDLARVRVERLQLDERADRARRTRARSPACR